MPVHRWELIWTCFAAPEGGVEQRVVRLPFAIPYCLGLTRIEFTTVLHNGSRQSLFGGANYLRQVCRTLWILGTLWTQSAFWQPGWTQACARDKVLMRHLFSGHRVQTQRGRLPLT